MKQTVDLNDFRNAFRNYGREENFTYEGLETLYDYLMSYEEDCGEEQELDVIAICCEFAEYDSIEEVLEEYSKEDIEELRDYTTVLEMDNGGIIIQQF